MPFNIDSIYLIYIVVALSAIFMVEAVYLIITRRTSYNKSKNDRLAAARDVVGGEQVLMELRRRRGLSTDGKYVLPVLSFNKLVVQSGTKLGINKLLAVCGGLALLALGVVSGFMRQPIWMGLLAAIVLGGAIPLAYLAIARVLRQRKFAAQLPDAIDIVVRSLRSGHPIPVALSMVGREMPDPVGSEFGMVLDELTYGLNMEEALRNMSYRVGQEDVGLMVTAVSLQASTGGNLSEVLTNLSTIIRLRFKMRRKVRALSAEGRISGYGLMAIPAILFVVLNVIAPGYYGDVWQHPLVVPLLIGAFLWGLVGGFVMYKMINFKF